MDQNPEHVTRDRLSTAHLVDVETSETIWDKVSVLERIARGERAIEEGRTHTHHEAKQRLSRWLK